MIEELEPVFEKCSDGVARQFPPHPYTLMHKINEIIRHLNEKVQLEVEQKELENWEHVGSQPKQEWSEEDDVYVKALVTMIEGAESVRIWLKQQALSPEGLVDWLKSLLAQPKQELGENAKLGLDRALQIVKSARGKLPGCQSDDGIYECDHAINVLEKLLNK